MRSDDVTRVSILLLALLAFGLRMYHLPYQSLWRDEADTLRFATQDLSQFFRMFGSSGQNGPLYFLSMRPWLAVAGVSEFALRFPSAWCGALAVPVTFRLLSTLAGRKPAALLALFMAVAPYLVWYGQEAKMYALLSLLVPLSLWLAVLAIRHSRWYYWAGLYLATTLAVYNHLLAPLAIPVQAAWMLLVPAAEPVRSRRRLLSVLLYLAALGLPYLPVAAWAVPLLLRGYQTGFAFVPLPAILQTLADVWSTGVFRFFSGLTAVPVLLAVLAGATLWIALRGRAGARLVAMLLVWALLPPLEIYLVSLGTPIFVDRYLIWAMPGFLALAALGVVALLQAWRPLGLVTLGALLALSAAGTAVQQTRPLKSDFRAAAAYVMSHRQPGDRIVFQIPYNRYLFEYYSGPLANVADGPYTNAGMSAAQLDQLMAGLTAGSSDVWLVEAEATLWDQRGLTQEWLGSHGQIVDRAGFTLVQVVRYQLGAH